MRRSLVAGIACCLVLAALPLTARASNGPAVTLLTPVAGQVVVGDMSITWSYRGFSRSAWVDVEASRGGEPFRRLARVRIDDGTPGYVGSTTWSTGPDDDAADWTVRVIVPSNKRVQSSVSPVVVDNGGPVATEAERSPAPNEAGWNNTDVTVRWLCTDRVSGALTAEVTATAADEGADQSVSATCTDTAGHSTTATASGINIDRTAPGAMVITFAAGQDTPSLGVFPTINGTAEDALSTVTGVTVAFLDEAGNETRRIASCPDCGTSFTGWTVPTEGLASGRYVVTALASDGAGNVGASSPVEYFIVAAPTLPPLTAPDVTAEPPPVEVPPVEVPEGTVPDPTVPDVPEATVPAIGLPA